MQIRGHSYITFLWENSIHDSLLSIDFYFPLYALAKNDSSTISGYNEELMHSVLFETPFYGYERYQNILWIVSSITCLYKCTQIHIYSFLFFIFRDFFEFLWLSCFSKQSPELDKVLLCEKLHGIILVRKNF